MVSMRRPRIVGALLAALTLAAMGTVVAAGPAYADEPGLWCTIASHGKITLDRSNVQYGDPVNVHWQLNLAECPSPIWFIDGPGFGTAIPTVGDRRVNAVTQFNTITWTLYLYDTEVDMPNPLAIASATVVVH